MNLNDALEQIQVIHGQMARGEVFRGYRSWTTGFSGVMALATAILQAVLLPDAASAGKWYVALWVAAAVVSLLAVGAEMVLRVRRTGSRLQESLTMLALEQFMPALVGGGLLTVAILSAAPAMLWLLPGLWQVMFAMGVFGSCRLMPRMTFWVGAFYLISGVCVILAGKGWAMSPLAMGLPFGIGQMATAAMLYWSLERKHEGA